MGECKNSGIFKRNKTLWADLYISYEQIKIYGKIHKKSIS